MDKIDQEVTAILAALMDLIVPSGMTAKERNALAKRAKVNTHTLRKNVKRKTLNADTLLRLLLARGVLAKTLMSLAQGDMKKLELGERGWIQLGRQLSELEKREFVDLIQYLRARWKLV